MCENDSMSACFSVAPSHVFLSLFYCPSLLFSNSHLCVHCSVILLSDLLVFTSSLFWTTLIADMMLLSFLFFFLRWKIISFRYTAHTQMPPCTTCQTGNLDYVHESQLDGCVCVCAYCRYCICVFRWGVGECAATGASDWPTGIGAQTGWMDGWMYVWQGKFFYMAHFIYPTATRSALQITQAKAQDGRNKNDKSEQTNADGIKTRKTNSQSTQ